MKKREERAREKTQRKESSEMAAATTPASAAAAAGNLAAAAPKRGSHFKEFLELHVSRSPRHSVSMSSVVGATTEAPSSVHAGAAADAGLVQRHGSAASRVHSAADTDPANAAAAVSLTRAGHCYRVSVSSTRSGFFQGRLGISWLNVP